MTTIVSVDQTVQEWGNGLAVRITAKVAKAARFTRGQLTLNVQAKRTEATVAVRVNEDMLARYLELSRAQVAAGAASMPTADGLLALRGVLEAIDDDEDAEIEWCELLAMMHDAIYNPMTYHFHPKFRQWPWTRVMNHGRVLACCVQF